MTGEHSTAARRLPWHWTFVLIGAFLVLFGVMNFAELPMGWKDRDAQIGRYLHATVGLGVEWIGPTLWAAKSCELALGAVAFGGLLLRETRLLVAALTGWLLVFFVYSGMDVWAADRAELLEHTTYFAVFCQLLVVVLVVSLLLPAPAALSAGVRQGDRRG